VTTELARCLIGILVAPICNRPYRRVALCEATILTQSRPKGEHGRRCVDRLISGSQLLTFLRANCSQLKPEREAELRPLIGLSPEQAKIAWERAVNVALATGDQKQIPDESLIVPRSTPDRDRGSIGYSSGLHQVLKPAP
jgi:hypothetical protein